MDRATIDAAFAAYSPVAVMHFAALSLVGELMKDPGRYWRVNVTGALNLIEATVAAGCRAFVFSSTCATYGDQDGVVLDEDDAAAPDQRLWRVEAGHRDRCWRISATATGCSIVIFRYFNVAGADPDGRDRRAAPPRDPPDPADAGRRRGPAPGADRVRHRLRHARRHLHPRLCPCARPGRGACAGAAPACWTAEGARLLPWHRARLFGARGHRASRPPSPTARCRSSRAPRRAGRCDRARLRVASGPGPTWAGSRTAPPCRR